MMPGVELKLSNRITEELVKDIDILFCNRFINGLPLHEVLALREKYGFKIIIDNDDYWELDPHHVLYHVYENGIKEAIKEFIVHADYTFVTHERLYEKSIKLNPNCSILPNAIGRYEQFDVSKYPSDYIRLFYAGSNTHVKDIELLKNPIKRFHWNNIEMVLCGHNEKNPELMRMATDFTNGGKLRNNLVRFLPVEEYYHFYSLCDIALIPLVDSKFNQYKSNLKILEAANVSSPVIVSKVHPYLGFPEDIVNYVSSQGDWYRQVKKLIENPNMVKEQGLALRDYCKANFNFEKINKERKQLFEYVAGKQSQVREVQAEVRHAS